MGDVMGAVQVAASGLSPNHHDDFVTAALYAAYAIPIVRETPKVIVDDGPPKFSSEWWDLVRKSQVRAGSTDNPFSLRQRRAL
jgi:hypothetical protein